MKAPFVSYRVADLDRSLGFYTALGYVELGRVGGGDAGHLVMLMGTGFDHLAIQVDTVSAWTPQLLPRPDGRVGQQVGGGTHRGALVPCGTRAPKELLHHRPALILRRPSVSASPA